MKAVSLGGMGNRAAIEALQLRNYDQLVETVHGYTMAGHRNGDRGRTRPIAQACGRPLPTAAYAISRYGSKASIDTVSPGSASSPHSSRASNATV